MPSVLSVLNPFARYATQSQSPPVLDMSAVLNSPAATSIAADGQSAVVLAFRSQSSQPVTFSLLNPGTGLSFGDFDPSYLVAPSPTVNSAGSFTVAPQLPGPDATGNYIFLALLWAPNTLPSPGAPLVTASLQAKQLGQTTVSQSFISLKPPPLVFVHGVWSSASGAGFTPGTGGLYDWIAVRYPHNFLSAADYGATSTGNPPTSLNSQTFSDPTTQSILLTAMTDGLARAANAGMAARTVDVVGHSMGGLVTRYFLSTGGKRWQSSLALESHPQADHHRDPAPGYPLGDCFV